MQNAQPPRPHPPPPPGASSISRENFPRVSAVSNSNELNAHFGARLKNASPKVLGNFAVNFNHAGNVTEFLHRYDVRRDGDRSSTKIFRWFLSRNSFFRQLPPKDSTWFAWPIFVFPNKLQSFRFSISDDVTIYVEINLPSGKSSFNCAIRFGEKSATTRHDTCLIQSK